MNSMEPTAAISRIVVIAITIAIITFAVNEPDPNQSADQPEDCREESKGFWSLKAIAGIITIPAPIMTTI